MDYQVIVIGGGTAGYVSAIRAAQLGFKTVCIDKWLDDGEPVLGGTCLNVGCIPSKVLLESTHQYANITKHAKDHGIEIAKTKLNTKTMVGRKNDIVKQLTSGIKQLFAANKVTHLAGSAQLLKDKKVCVTDHNNKKITISGDYIIIATGSVVANPFKGVAFDGKYIVNSEHALNFTKPPKTLAVIGAGAIGLEMGSVWCRAGSQTTVFEANKTLLAEADKDIAKAVTRELAKQGLNFQLGASVSSITTKGKGVELTYTNSKGKQTLEKFDKVLIATGRVPYTNNLFANDVGIATDKRGFIEVDDNCQTAIPDIYAIGDVVRGPMLAHKGSDEGIAVAERIARQQPHIDYDKIPMVIYTHPEVAWVGMSQQQAKDKGLEIKVGKFNFSANGRAKAANDTVGLVKIIADANTDRLLGVHIFGLSASELISGAVIALECQCSAEDLARTIFAHPTLSEAIHEAALDVDKRMIHSISRK